MTHAQTVLAFDFGLKRIGIASGDTLTRTAAPRAAVRCGASGPDWELIERERAHLACDELPVGDAAMHCGRSARRGVPRERVAAGDANTFESEVEGEDGLRARHALQWAPGPAPTGVPEKLRV